RPDEQATGALHDLEVGPRVAEIVLVALGPAMQRIDLQLAAMQPRGVARVDAAFKRLQPVALLQPLRDVALRPPHPRELELRQWGLSLRRAQIGPQHVAALHQRIGLQLDLLAEARLLRLRRHVDALPGPIVFPAVIGAAQPVLLIAADPQRGATMSAEL